MAVLLKLTRRLARLKGWTVVFAGLAACAGDHQVASPDRAGPPPHPSFAPVAAPGTVSDLAVASVADTMVALSFTQVGDGTGAPASHDVRFAPSPMSWGSAMGVTKGTCTTPLARNSIGATMTCTVTGLTQSTKSAIQI